MANAVTAYRDMSLSDRNTDAGDIAMLAYLDESAQPQPPPPPLPPLAPDRRKGSQNLPPVRNLLTQPEEWDQSKQNSSNKSKQNNVRRKVSTIAKGAETIMSDKILKNPDKPAKRGPKGPRKQMAPRPLGPLKPIAPKVVEKPEEAPTNKAKPRKPPSKKPTKRAIKEKQGNQINLDTTTSDEVLASSTLINMNTNAELDLSQSFNIQDLSSIESALLGSGNNNIGTSNSTISNQSPPFQAPLDSLHHHPQAQNTAQHNMIAAMAYASPQTNFSPVSETGNPNFTQMYHSPVFPTSHSSHVTPHPVISPLHSMNNSPHSLRSQLASDLAPPVTQLNLDSPVQLYSNRLPNGTSNSPEFIGVDGPFQSPIDMNSISSRINGTGRSTAKRKGVQDRSSDQTIGKRRILKPRTSVTAIQSVLNPANDGRLDASNPPTISHKGNRIRLPVTPTSPNHLRRPAENAFNALRLQFPGISSVVNEAFPDPPTSLTEDQSRQFDLQNNNSLSMVLNSDHGSSPQIYEFPPLDTSNSQTSNIIPASTQRDVSGRLPVQSLLTLPPIPVEDSPSMQVMQIQPGLLDQSSQLQNMGLGDQRRLVRTTANDPNDIFDIRMTVDNQTHFGSGLADVVGTNLQRSSSWTDILLQPNTSPTFPNEIGGANEALFDGNQMPSMEERPANPSMIRYSDSQIGNTMPSGPPINPEPAKESEISTEPNIRPNQRKRRGKHSRYLAAAGKNGEPDKTHIDLLVTVIQKSETGVEPLSSSTQTSVPSETQYETNVPPSMDEVSLAVLAPHNSLPSIETLQLVDTAANSGQTAQGRAILDEMARITSSQEQPANNLAYDMLDLFEDDPWNGLMLPSSGNQAAMPVRYTQWNQPEYQEPTQPEVNEPRAITTPVALPKLTRKSKDDQKQLEQEKPPETTKTGQYICQHPGCTSRFTQLNHFKTHVASHEGIRPFKCNFDGCDQTFSQKGNLKAHQRKHTGEKPFICDECDKAFAQKGNLQTHKSVHTGLKPYVCLIDNCTARYSQRGNLKMHQNKFHTERIQQLTIKYQASTKGGPPLTDAERKVADHLKILYKFANKGIKGRGKKGSETKPSETATTTIPQETTTTARTESLDRPTTESRVFTEEQSLLPIPMSKNQQSLIQTPSFMGSTSWSSRGGGEDVFVGNQNSGSGHGQMSSNSFLGIPGDSGSSGVGAGGLGGYAFGGIG